MKSFQAFFCDVLINEAEAPEKLKVNISSEILPMQPEGETSGTSSSKPKRGKKVSRPVSQSTIDARYSKAKLKQYRTPSGEITAQGIRNYYTRSAGQGYGDPGKQLKGGQETLRQANELTTNITPEKKRQIKRIYKNIETRYPVPQSVQQSTPIGFRQFSRSISTGAQNRAQAASDIGFRQFSRSISTGAQNRAQAASDAAQDIAKRKVDNKAAGFKDLAKAVQNVSDKPKITGDVQALPKPSKVTTNLTTSPDAPKPPKTPALKPATTLTKAARVAGVVGTGLQGYLDYKAEREKGSGKLRSAAAGAASVLGGALGGALGSVAGPIGGLAGATAGTYAAQKAFDVAAGANAKQRAAMDTLRRQSQSGKALVGTGGRTTFSSKGKDMFMSTGAPDSRKTVQLAKTSVIKDPVTGKSEVGYLAKQGGQAVYKRGSDPSSLAKTSTNWLERVGRTIAPGAYKQHDIQQTQAKLKQAQASDAAMKKKLGVK